MEHQLSIIKRGVAQILPKALLVEKLKRFRRYRRKTNSKKSLVDLGSGLLLLYRKIHMHPYLAVPIYY